MKLRAGTVVKFLSEETRIQLSSQTSGGSGEVTIYVLHTPHTKWG